MTVFDHALQLTEDLADGVSDFEVRCASAFSRGPENQDRVRKSVVDVWPSVVANARDSEVTLEREYVAALHHKLAVVAGTRGPGRFTDGGSHVPWDVFVAEISEEAPPFEDAWIVAELFWGNYVQSLPLTLGWLLMNGLRLQDGRFAILPASETFEQFQRYLSMSGPESYDAESLRALMYQYEQRQTPDPFDSGN